MNNPAQALIELKKEKNFLIGIDSDGCAFDTMEVKHKECFIPNIINEWDLQAVSKFAREAAEFVNLYSEWRGINRFPALVKVFDLLEEREEVKKRGFKKIAADSLRKWIETETRLGNPALEEIVKKTKDPVLERTLKWSRAVNQAVENLVRGVPPYPYVRESLEKMKEYADIIVVSATPGEALQREWEEHDIAKYVKVIAGQEMGTKKEHLSFARKGRYEDAHVLMIGDALGDLKAAKANNVLFYPINPGNEDISWQRFCEEAFDKFINCTYAGDYEAELISEFEKYLPSTPPWKQKQRCCIIQEDFHMNKADLGLIGLAVMGENLVMNMESKGFTVAVFNRSTEKVTSFIEGRAKGKNIIGTYSIEELINAVKRPRKIMLMVKAGKPVDDFIELLIPYLDKGDIIIDGGNSHFPDTIRRTKHVEEKGLLFIGTGVSGGEEGALKGPSIMPGGSFAAWTEVAPIFQKIAARVADGSPCCQWVGDNGAGHFVKMVHNGIEYGDMQLICEAYFIMKHALGMNAGEMHQVFAGWNKGELDSYLIEITAGILSKVDKDTGKPMVDLIMDTAGQKGTGKWTSQAALDFGVSTPTITEAVFARCISAIKDERVAASKILSGTDGKYEGNREEFIEAIRQALYASKICSYAQGFAMMREASREYNWNLKFGEIALMWRGGCIIRARFLQHIKDAFDKQPELPNLLLAPYFTDIVQKAQTNWRLVISTAVTLGLPVPAFSSALAYFDSYRRETLPANLLQAQRDYFGAHTYNRIDRPGTFHTEWLTEGDLVTSDEI